MRVARGVFVFAALFGCLAWAETQESKPKVSEKPFTAEQLAVYQSVLGNWMAGELATVNLGIQTTPLKADGLFGMGDCGKGIDLEPATAEVHRFRAEDLAKLGAKEGARRIVLVDPDRQRQEVADNDPERGIRKGKSIEDAVSEGFAHGLVTLSEIRFDKEHKLAIVSFGFFCGSLCGNGGTVVLEKTESGWRRKTQCEQWIS